MRRKPRRPEGSLALLEEGLAGKRRLFVNCQVFRELLVVATRRVTANGLGMAPIDALANLNEFSRGTRLLPETESVSRSLKGLVGEQPLQEKRIHDANIVATMLTHGLTCLVSNKASDFEAFPGISMIG